MRTVAVAALLVVFGVAASVPASAVESYVCWTETRSDADIALPRDVLVCRIAGGELVVFDRPSEAPLVLHPAVARDATGSCWHWRSGFTGWVIVGFVESGVVLRYERSGGALLYDATFEPCVAEPVGEVSSIELVWRVVRRYAAPVPDVVVDPPISVTGLDTYVVTNPPGPITDSIVSPVTGRRISVVLEVSRVAVSWGDGASEGVIAGSFDRLGGHPDGMLRHIYDERGLYSVTVTYDRVARWRLESGPWHVLDLGPASAVVQLRVDELVTRRVG